MGNIAALLSLLLQQEGGRESNASFVHGEEGVVEKINRGKLVINILIYLFCLHPLFNHYSVQVMEGVQKC